jgi:glucose/arabinose dehydrogenase
MNPIRFAAALAAVFALGSPAAAQSRAACLPDNAGLTLPPGFCALVVAESVGPARHLVVAPTGDIYVAVRNTRQTPGAVVALRDTDGDGVADVRVRFGPGGGSGIALHDGYLYFATDDSVVRWPWRPGSLQPAGPAETMARELVNRGAHSAKGIALGADGYLYVNVGAPSNACQAQDRQPGVPGQDPCPLLDLSGGIWRFKLDRPGQTQTEGERIATGLRNSWAMAWDPSGALYAIQHGRDMLHGNWPGLYTPEQSAEKPAEELFKIEVGGDYGWPYCYYDPELKQKVLAPEYGGDGKKIGRCAAARAPEVAFPAHWAPNGLLFYTGTQFPAEYRGGVFVAFHGSWNRAPLPQGGYNVTFAPFVNGKAAGTYRVFATGFTPPDPQPRTAGHRPTGLALGPDGSLYVSDDLGGRIYRILYR